MCLRVPLITTSFSVVLPLALELRGPISCLWALLLCLCILWRLR